MTIEKEEIERIKKGVDLVALIESKGILLKKNGKGFVGLCPFHDDTNPSMTTPTHPFPSILKPISGTALAVTRAVM